MALFPSDSWSRFYEPMLLPTGMPNATKIPPYLGRYVPVFMGKFEQTAHPREVLGEVLADWVHEFIREQNVAETRVSAYMDHLTFEVRVRIDLHLTREQEFILRLEKGHLLPN